MKLKFFLIGLYNNRNGPGRSYLQLFCPTCKKYDGELLNHWRCAGQTLDARIEKKENNNSQLYCSGYKQDNDKVKKL